MLSVPFGGSVRCMRHNSTRLAAVGEVSNKESGSFAALIGPRGSFSVACWSRSSSSY